VLDTRKWGRILLLALLGSFNVEIVTGFSAVKDYFPMTCLGYAIPLAIADDLTARYRLDYKHIFLIGTIYGVLVDGIIVKAAFSPYWNDTFGPPDVFDMRLGNFLSFVPFGHGFITFVLSFALADLVVPRQGGGRILTRWHYLALLPLLLTLWLLMFASVHSQDDAYLPSWRAVLTILAYLGAVVGVQRLLKRSAGMYVFTCVMASVSLVAILGFDTKLADAAVLAATLAVAVLTLKADLSHAVKCGVATFAFMAWIVNGLFTTHANPLYAAWDRGATILYGLGILTVLGRSYLGRKRSAVTDAPPAG
jgi:hypothetical protein